MTTHYLNQCWNIVGKNAGKKFQWNLNRNLHIFIQKIHLKTLSRKCRPFCFGVNVLILAVVKKIYKIFDWFMNGLSWEIVSSFVTKDVSLQGGSTQNLRIHAECSAIWSGFWPILVTDGMRVSRTQCQTLRSCNQLHVIQFCTSYWYLKKITSQFCTWFGNRVIVLWVKVRTSHITRSRITAKI